MAEAPLYCIPGGVVLCTAADIACLPAQMFVEVPDPETFLLEAAMLLSPAGRDA